MTNTELPRLSMYLTKRAATQLDQLTEQTGFSKTDVVNRAINLYKFVNDRLENSDEVLIRTQGNEVARLLIQ